MTTKFIGILEWLFQFGLISVLATTIIFVRRLEAVLRQVRNDHESLQAILRQIDGAIATAASAAAGLTEDAANAESMLQATCRSADAAARKLDDLIGQANLIRSTPPAPPIVADETRTARPAAVRKPAKSMSRAESDLARVLLHAT